MKSRRRVRGRRDNAWLELRWRDQVWLVQRPAQGVWAGLWSLPELDSIAALEPRRRAGPAAARRGRRSSTC